ncbi:MAG TPA: hypothetical protein VLF67_02700 [Candidatus Saccharimonas sp.]|nr:hypothetical protein [Candidatus Saccharimonas sp.]
MDPRDQQTVYDALNAAGRPDLAMLSTTMRYGMTRSTAMTLQQTLRYSTGITGRRALEIVEREAK